LTDEKYTVLLQLMVFPGSVKLLSGVYLDAALLDLRWLLRSWCRWSKIRRWRRLHMLLMLRLSGCMWWLDCIAMNQWLLLLWLAKLVCGRRWYLMHRSGAGLHQSWFIQGRKRALEMRGTSDFCGLGYRCQVDRNPHAILSAKRDAHSAL
jgi:hypothetical protein